MPTQRERTLVQSYIKIMNRSKADVVELLMSPCMNSRSLNAVTSGNTFHVFQAVLLPLPPNEDMVPHPVNAWKTWRVAKTLGSIAAATSWTGMYPKVCATLHVV